MNGSILRMITITGYSKGDCVKSMCLEASSINHGLLRSITRFMGPRGEIRIGKNDLYPKESLTSTIKHIAKKDNHVLSVNAEGVRCDQEACQNLTVRQTLIHVR